MSIFSKKIGIDLGTANTLVFVPGKGVVINEPSVVSVNKDTGEVIAIGQEAKDMVGKTPDNIITYKPMKDGVIADYRVTEAMLRYFIQKAMGKWNIIRPDVVISVPAGVTSTERRAVIEAAVKAGAKMAYPVKETILAALGAGIPIDRPLGHMIVDIGGGTTDVAVISLGSIQKAVSVKCAGNKIDEAIAEHIRKKYNLIIGDKTAEEIKIRIGAAIKLEEELTITIKGRDHVEGLPRTATISTNEIVGAIGRELNEIIQAIRDVFEETKPELAGDILESGIILTGGTSQLRGLGNLVFARTGVKAATSEEALFCVIKGIGIVLDKLDYFKKTLTTKAM
jgi:rod shape-determining protein MreB and related proteins